MDTCHKKFVICSHMQLALRIWMDENVQAYYINIYVQYVACNEMSCVTCFMQLRKKLVACVACN